MGINPNTGEVAAASSDNPLGLGSPLSGQWNLFAQTPDSNSHLFSTPQGPRTVILTLLGGFHSQPQNL
jgi:photosystem I P700 chlorophyll a apoprotein A2